VLRSYCAEFDRDPADVAVTVLDVPIVAADRTGVATLVDVQRGRTPAATFARRHHAGTIAEQTGRYRLLAVAGAHQVECFAPIVAAFA